MENKKGSGIVAIGGIVLGILCLAGGAANLPGMLVSVLKILGIGCIAIGILAIALVAASIVMASKEAKEDGRGTLKAGVNTLVRAKEQEITKLKSKISVTEMELKKIERKNADLSAKIDACDIKSEEYVKAGKDADAKTELSNRRLYTREKERLAELIENYQNTLFESKKRLMELQDSLIDLESRSDAALSKLGHANDIKNGLDLDKLEEDAQYEEDYANALKELEGLERRAGK